MERWRVVEEGEEKGGGGREGEAERKDGRERRGRRERRERGKEVLSFVFIISKKRLRILLLQFKLFGRFLNKY